MTFRLPPLHARRSPEFKGLSATLTHPNGWAALSTLYAPQALDLTLCNRTPHEVDGRHAQLHLTFRPGELTKTQHITLGPQSQNDWSLRVEEFHPDTNANAAITSGDSPHIKLILASARKHNIAPGDRKVVQLQGLCAAPDRGTRHTRVELTYAHFLHPDGTHIDGHELIPLPIVRRSPPTGLEATKLRTGSTAQAGPFQAGFTQGGDILNDGLSAGQMTLRVSNCTPDPIELSGDAAMHTRFVVSFQTGRENAEWGLLGSHADHMGILLSSDDPDWQIDHHTIRRTANGAIPVGGFIDLDLTLHTHGWTGEAQLVVTYENLPRHDDADLVLLVKLGPTATDGNSFQVVDAVHAGGAITSSAHYMQTKALRFTVSGAKDRFYAYQLTDLTGPRNGNQETGPMRAEIFTLEAANTPAFWADLSYLPGTSTHGSGVWSIDAHQGAPTRFIAGATEHPDKNGMVIWLRGKTTYGLKSNQRSAIGKAVKPKRGSLNLRSRSGTNFDPGFDAPRVSMDFNGALSITQMPIGAVIAYAGKVPPPGWLLCNGASIDRKYGVLRSMFGNGKTPDLTDSFIRGATAGNIQTTGGQDDVTLTTGKLPKLESTFTSTSIDDHDHAGTNMARLEDDYDEDIKVDLKYIGKVTILERDEKDFYSVLVDEDHENSISDHTPQHEGRVKPAGGHAHEVTVTFDPGTQTAVPTVPPFYRLVYIIKA